MCEQGSSDFVDGTIFGAEEMYITEAAFAGGAPEVVSDYTYMDIYYRSIARKENDFTAEPLLNWFLNEQIEEENNTDKICRQMEMVGDSKEGLFMLDRELGTRIYPAGSPFDPLAYNLVP